MVHPSHYVQGPREFDLIAVAEVRHSIEPSDGFTNSRDCTKEAPTGSQGMAGEFAVVRS